MSQGNVTTDHNRIRQWAEERGGTPATVKQTKADGEPGVLRLDFEPRDEALEPISWEDFFEKFEHERLAFFVSGPDGGRRHQPFPQVHQPLLRAERASSIAACSSR